MDIITIIVLAGITNLTFALYSWQQISNPESHAAVKQWAQAHFIKAISFAVYAVSLVNASDDLRLLANILILLGAWAEVRAYNKLSDAGIKPSYLFAGFVITSAIFSYAFITSGAGPSNITVVAASFLLAFPLAMNVYVLYRLSKQHHRSVFPKVLLSVNLVITILIVVRGIVAFDNPEYTIIEAWFINQLFMTATFIHVLGNGIGFLGFLKERSDEKLQIRANIDYLTGIHNRQYFEKLVRARIDSGTKFTLYFLDIDKFKSVNDRFGHATGDDVLRQFSQLLLESQEQYNGIAGRLGGEEFGLLLPASTKANHTDIVAQLRSEFASQAEKSIGEPLTFSLGECSSSDANTVQDLMRKADVLLYEAKRKV